MNIRKAILQVEDEDHDAMFLKYALERADVKNPLAVVRDGQEAIAYMRGEGKFGNREAYPLPGLVLLDLRLPHVPGLEVLRWMREQADFEKVPVIIFFFVGPGSDVDATYRAGANAYIVKPSSPAELLEIVRRVKKYWLEMEEPPDECPEWTSIIVPRPVSGQHLRGGSERS